MNYFKKLWIRLKRIVRNIFIDVDDVVEELSDSTISELKEILNDASRKLDELNGLADNICKTNLEKLTKKQLISYAKDRFNENLSMSSRKSEIIEEIISLNEQKNVL